MKIQGGGQAPQLEPDKGNDVVNQNYSTSHSASIAEPSTDGFVNSAAAATQAAILNSDATRSSTSPTNDHGIGSIHTTAASSDNPTSTSRSAGPEEIIPVDPSQGPQGEDTGPHKVNDIIHLSTGNSYLVESAFFNPNSNSYEYDIQRVKLGDNGAPEPWEDAVTLPEDLKPDAPSMDTLEGGVEYPVEITGQLFVNKETGDVEGVLRLDLIDGSTGWPHTGSTHVGAARILSGDKQVTNAPFGIPDKEYGEENLEFFKQVVEHEDMAQEIRELLNFTIEKNELRGEIPDPGEPHPEDSDIGPEYEQENGPTGGHGSSGGGGGGWGSNSGGGGAGGWGGVGGGIEGGIGQNGPLSGDTEGGVAQPGGGGTVIISPTPQA